MQTSSATKDQHSSTSQTLIPLADEAVFVRQQVRQRSPFKFLYDVLDAVSDPEIPILSIWDMGILQDIEVGGGCIVVVITPTYSGCPAMSVIEADIVQALQQAAFANVFVQLRLTPVWTTDWMSIGAQKRLVEFGVSAPSELCCPQCDIHDVELVSEFGSTACKALYRCRTCFETFDYFKRF